MIRKYNNDPTGQTGAGHLQVTGTCRPGAFSGESMIDESQIKEVAEWELLC